MYCKHTGPGPLNSGAKTTIKGGFASFSAACCGYLPVSPAPGKQGAKTGLAGGKAESTIKRFETFC
jgi:hypothetical protein